MFRSLFWKGKMRVRLEEPGRSLSASEQDMKAGNTWDHMRSDRAGD